MRCIYSTKALILSFSLTQSSCNKEDSDFLMNVDNGVYTFSFNQTNSEIHVNEQQFFSRI